MNKAGRKKSKPEGWREVKLENVVEINPSERIAQGTKAKKVNMDALIPFTRKIPKYVNETYKSGSKFRNGDTLLARITPCLENGKTAFVDFLASGEVGFGSTEFIVMREKKDITDKDFVYHFARSDNFRNMAIKSMTGSSGRQRVEIDEVKQYKFYLPPLAEQEAIAEVLSSLDDKIDLLHRQNKTLEDMAQALFRQWFIEEANEEWEEKSLDRIAEYLNGLACQKYPPKNEKDKLPVLKIKELSDGINEGTDWVSSEIDKKYVIELGDVIFSWSGSLMVKIWTGEKCVLNQHLFKITSENYPKWFYYFWTRRHLKKFIQIAESKTTTMGHIKRGDLSNSVVLVPTSSELQQIDEEITPSFEKIISNHEQIGRLEKLRDILLPKLIGGKVSVRP